MSIETMRVSDLHCPRAAASMQDNGTLRGNQNFSQVKFVTLDLAPAAAKFRACLAQ